MTTQPRLQVGSLFAGIGGFDLAAERAGMEVAFQSEVDRHASAVLDHHWPAVKNLGDIHGIGNGLSVGSGERRGELGHRGGTVTDSSIRNDTRDMEATTNEARACPPGVDVLTGGFPCQDYSVAGSRGGLAGDRGALWWEYHRLIVELRPTWIVGENVPGLLSSRGGADFETIVGSLTECGYGVAWAVLDAQYFGVAQRRRRVFIVGHIGGVPRPEVLALGEGLFGHPQPRRETGEATAALTEASAGGAGLDDQAVAHLVASGFDWTQNGAEPVEELSPSLRVGSGIGIPSPPAVAFSAGNSGESGTNQVPTIAAFGENIRGEVLETEYVRSLNVGGGKPGQGYPAARVGSSVRRLTPLECERLQGFPDGHTDIPGNSDTQRYRQLGNAVAVPVVEWIMNRIVEVSK